MVDMNKRDRPKPYIDKALDMLLKNEKYHAVDILEIGCMRSELIHHVDITDYECCSDGHSTYLFARTGLHVISVDISKSHIERAAKSCWQFGNVTFVTADAIEYIRELKSIDVGLLFLDAWDVDLPECAEKHLEFYNIIKHKLNDDCLILIDDTDLWYNQYQKEYFYDAHCLSGKGKLLIPELKKDGYKIVFNGRQTLLRK